MISAYNSNRTERFEYTGSNIFTSIDEITIGGVAYYALKGRTSGGGEISGRIYFEGEVINDLSDSNILTRVRSSDANVTVVSARILEAQ